MTPGWIRFVPSLVCVLCLLGCTGQPRETLVRVAGTLEVDGQPVGGVRLSFMPADHKPGRGGYANTDAKGAFTVTHDAQGRPGLAVGNYIVSYSKMVMSDGSPLPKLQDGKAPTNAIIPKESLPAHLTHPDPQSPGTTKITIPKEGNTKLELKVSTKALPLELMPK